MLWSVNHGPVQSVVTGAISWWMALYFIYMASISSCNLLSSHLLPTITLLQCTVAFSCDLSPDDTASVCAWPRCYSLTSVIYMNGKHQRVIKYLTFSHFCYETHSMSTFWKCHPDSTFYLLDAALRKTKTERRKHSLCIKMDDATAPQKWSESPLITTWWLAAV